MTVESVRVTSDEQIIVCAVKQVNAMLIPVGDHISLEEVFIIDDFRFTVESLNDDLFAIGFQEHILDEWLIEEVDVVPLKQSVVDEQWRHKEKGVAHDSTDCGDEDRRDEERIDDCGV